MAWIATNQADLAVAQCKFNLILGPDPGKIYFEEELITTYHENPPESKKLGSTRQTNGVWISDKCIFSYFSYEPELRLWNKK